VGLVALAIASAAISLYLLFQLGQLLGAVTN